MASEYLKWKARNEKPREKTVLTPAEKRANWWDYHKWHVGIGIVLLLIMFDLAKSALHIGEPQYDYQIAYVGSRTLPTDTVSAAETAFAALGEDANGDGKVTVRLNQYAETGKTDQDTAAYSAASSVKLMADLESCDSFFFLLEDPDRFQEQYEALSLPDGSFPKHGAYDWEDCCFSWTDCPALAGQELGSYTENILGEEFRGENTTILDQLFLARRGFWNNQSIKNQAECEDLWEKITKGADS